MPALRPRRLLTRPIQGDTPRLHAAWLGSRASCGGEGPNSNPAAVARGPVSDPTLATVAPASQPLRLPPTVFAATSSGVQQLAYATSPAPCAGGECAAASSQLSLMHFSSSAAVAAATGPAQQVRTITPPWTVPAVSVGQLQPHHLPAHGSTFSSYGGGATSRCLPTGEWLASSLSAQTNLAIMRAKSAIMTGEVEDDAAEEAGARSMGQVLHMLGARDGQVLVQIVMEECDRGSLHQLLGKASRATQWGGDVGFGSATSGALAHAGTGAGPRLAKHGSGSASGGGDAFGTPVTPHTATAASRQALVYSPFLLGGRWTVQQALKAVLLTAKEIALGMSYLHVNNILHGDLKPANVLLRSSRADQRGFICKISDFGLSRVLHPEQPEAAVATQHSRRFTDSTTDSACEPLQAAFPGPLTAIPFAATPSSMHSHRCTNETGEGPFTAAGCGAVPEGLGGMPARNGLQVGVQGTVAYLAPEVIDGTRTKAADVYSFGVVLWQLVTGQRPFENLMPEQILAAISISCEEGTCLLEFPPACHPGLAAMGQACLSPSPLMRPSFAQIIRKLMVIEAELKPDGLAEQVPGV